MADKKISALDDSALLTGTEYIPIVQPANNPRGNKRVTIDDLMVKAPVQSVNGLTGEVTITAAGLGALESGDNISLLTNDIGYLTNSSQSVNPTGGNAGQVLTKDSSSDYDYSWQTLPSSFADPMTTRGDIIIRNSSNTTTRLGIGANTYVLTSDGVDISWQPSSGSISGSGTTNELTYWTGSSAIGSLSTATYPSLTELSYVKGLTSSAQTQITARELLTNKATSFATLNNTLYPTTQSLFQQRSVTGTDSLVAADTGKTIVFNSATPFNFTVDALVANAQVALINKGAGTVTLIAGTGVTLTGTTTLATDETRALIFYTATTVDALGGGGSSSYTFTNGLTESGGTVKLGGTLIENTTIDTDGFDFNLSGVVDGGVNGSWYFNVVNINAYNSGTQLSFNQGTDVPDGYVSLLANNYSNGFLAGYDGSKRGFGIYTGTAANERLFINENGSWSVNGSAGTSGYVLTSNGSGSSPTWQTQTSGFANPMTTEGDLILATTGGTATRLAIGANTYVLTSNGTTASWQPASGGGDVVGPASATENAIALFDGTTGKIIKNSTFTLDETNSVARFNPVTGGSGTNYNSNFFGFNAGSGSSSINSNYFGVNSGFGSTGSANNFFGNQAGYNTNGTGSNFFGSNAGNGATNSSYSNFFGASVGTSATNASYSNFFGASAGYAATNASNSNFFGKESGYGQTSATYSTFLGFQAGRSFSSNILGANNIIIGTNISMVNGTTNSINIGGVLFGKNTYGTTTGNSSLTAVANGSIGIGVVPASITARLHLPAGTATANTAPLKLTSGTALTTPEDGAIEYHGSHLYFTIGSTRYQLDQQGGGTTDFADNVFRISDNSDSTKKIAFEASGITTGTVRTFTAPDASGTIALTSDLSGWLTGTLTGDVNIDDNSTGTHIFQIGNFTPVNSVRFNTTNAVSFDVDNGSTYRTSFGADTDNIIFTLTQNPFTIVRQIGLNSTGAIISVGSDATGDTYYRNSSGYFTRLGIGAEGTILRAGASVPAYSTFTIPNTISALSTFVSNSANVLTEVTPSAGQSIRVNAGGTAWEAYTPGSGGGDVTKVGTPVDNQVGVWTGDGTIEGTTGFTYNGSNLQLTGDIGSTGTRITKGWFTDLQVTNAIAGSITGNAATVTTNANLTGHITSTGNATLLGSFTLSQLNTAISDANVENIANKATSLATLNNDLYPTTQSLFQQRSVTGTDAIVAADNGKTIVFNSASPFNFTIDALTAGMQMALINKGTGTVTLVAGSGVTLGGVTTLATNESAAIIYYTSTSVDAIGGGGTALTNPMTTEGDIILAGSGGTPTRLGIGTNGYVLTSNGTTASWQAGGGGGITIGSTSITGGTSGRLLTSGSTVGEQTLGTGVSTWLSTPSWTNFQSAITGTAPYWSLASGGTLTGANTITGTTSNTLTFDFPSIGVTDYDSFVLDNSTAATSGNQQKSPTFILRGQGWKTNSTASSQSVEYMMDVLPVQGAAAPTFVTRKYSSINNGAKSPIGFWDRSDGVVIFGPSPNSDYVKIYGTNINDASTIVNGAAGTFWGYTANTGVTYPQFIYGFSGTNGCTSTAGEAVMINYNGRFIPTSGNANWTVIGTTITINQTGGASGLVRIFNPTVNVTAGTSLTGYYWNPTNPNNLTGNNISFHAVSGNMLLPASSYLNLGSTVGSSGYGFRDNGGTMEFKNSAGSWTAFGSGGWATTGTTNLTGDVTINGTGSYDITMTSVDMILTGGTSTSISGGGAGWGAVFASGGSYLFGDTYNSFGATTSGISITTGSVSSTARLSIDESGDTLIAASNLSLFESGAGYDSGSKVLFFGNVVTEPTGNPANGFYAWAEDTEPEGSNLKIRTTEGHFAKPVLQKKVTVSGGATLRAIGSTPVEIIAAPGSNKYLNIIGITISYNYGTAVYNFAAGEIPVFKFSGATTDGFRIPLSIINGSTDTNLRLSIFTATGTDYDSLPSPTNTAFVLGTADNGDATTGDGDIDVIVYYTIENSNT